MIGQGTVGAELLHAESRSSCTTRSPERRPAVSGRATTSRRSRSGSPTSSPRRRRRTISSVHEPVEQRGDRRHRSSASNFAELSKHERGACNATAAAAASPRRPASASAAARAGLSTPYGGTAPTLPGTVEVENYDNGGAGHRVLRHDRHQLRRRYRTNAVDMKAATDTGGGYLVGWTHASEWLNYTVNVSTARTYAIDVRLASNGVGGTFHIEVNGVDKTGPLDRPEHGRLARLDDGHEDRRRARRRSAGRPRRPGRGPARAARSPTSTGLRFDSGVFVRRIGLPAEDRRRTQ